MSHFFFFFLMIRRPPRSTQSRSSAASDVYKRQGINAEYGNSGNDMETVNKSKKRPMEEGKGSGKKKRAAVEKEEEATTQDCVRDRGGRRSVLELYAALSANPDDISALSELDMDDLQEIAHARATIGSS
eukprot:TRINITY_DN254_c0_g2_i5.p2 TRINITY_DN254_c0_g2~~TRINITY_DN254_c0_g2_i5.p2  ORF type:complete len:130 (+),score=69.60 TRINITY_DN254_c0_g2_i5:95-484(+)